MAEQVRVLLLVRAAVQVQGMSNGTPSPTGPHSAHARCSADESMHPSFPYTPLLQFLLIISLRRPRVPLLNVP